MLWVFWLGCTSSPSAGLAEPVISAAQAAPPPSPAAVPGRPARGSDHAAVEGVRAHFVAFAKDCAVEGIHSPVVTRVLRNTAFAMAGRRFSSIELMALFNADGGWYQPVSDAVSLPRDQKNCVDALAKREAYLRSAHCFEDDGEAVITGNRALYLWHRDTGFLGFDPDLGSMVEAGMQNPVPDGLDACDPAGLVGDATIWTTFKWKITQESVPDAEAAIASVYYGDAEFREAVGLTYEPGRWRKEQTQIRRWVEEGELMHRLTLKMRFVGWGEGFEGMSERKCVGPGAAPTSQNPWICYGYGLP